MIYELLNKDRVFAVFDVVAHEKPDRLTGKLKVENEITRIAVYDANLYTAVVGRMNLLTFLQARKAPKHRAHIAEMFAYLNMDNVINFLDISYGLSMIDTIWARPTGSGVQWKDVNLFDNEFNEVIAHYAFNGTGLFGQQFKSTSPEHACDGALPKMWVRESDGPHLYKAGTGTGKHHFANDGFEPFAEYYAYKVAERMDFYPYVPYDLQVVKGLLVSNCPVFTSKDKAYVSMARAMAVAGVDDKLWVEWLLNIGLLEDYRDVLFFDCTVCNGDRHHGNFGPVCDTATYSLEHISPIFDNGMSLGFGWLPGKESIIEWVNRAGPCNVDGTYVSVGKSLLNEKRHAAIERLRGWTIPKHPKYNWSDAKYEAMNELLQHQVREILS